MAFVRVYEGNQLLAQYELVSENTSIGRGPDNDIVLAESAVSKHHATIEKRGGSYFIIDNQSANGTLVDGESIRQRRLNFRDEVQVGRHTMVFMPTAKLPGEALGGAPIGREGLSQDATVAIDISDIGDLVRQRKQHRVAYVEKAQPQVGASRHVLDQVNFSVGRSPQCNIRTRGWWAPRVSATIQRRSDGHYLMPARRGRVAVNGRPIREPVKLADADDLLIRDISLRFYFRPVYGS